MTEMSILVMGNLGYIGPAVIEAIRRNSPGAVLHGFDTGYFEAVTTHAVMHPSQRIDVQHYGDARNVEPSLFSAMDAVVYLAAISNDPMGREFAEPTHAINTRAAIAAANMAKEAGVSSFVFASSCSVYGAGGSAAKTERDRTEPLTDYARSKLASEAALEGIAGEDFAVTCLRFATACGPSPRMRLDLVLNDFVASALSSGEITILSDGSPLRPLIDVRDMGSAIAWAVQRKPEQGGAHLIVNTGRDDWNFSVLEIAEHVAGAFDKVSVSVADASGPDNRSYRVDFSLFDTLARDVLPARTLTDSIQAIASSLSQSAIPYDDFRSGPLIRLNVLRALMAAGHVDMNLRWTYGN